MSITIKSVQASKGNQNNTIHLAIKLNGCVNNLSLFQDSINKWHPSITIDSSNCGSSNSLELKNNIADMLHNLADVITSKEGDKIDTLINMFN